MTFVFHSNPYVPFDEDGDDDALNRSPGHGPGIGRCEAMSDELLPTAVDAARLRVGARPLPVDQWVSRRDATWDPTIEMKRRLIRTRPGETVAAMEHALEACDEAASGVMTSIGMGPGDESGLDALIEASVHVADDLCILCPDERGVPRLSAAVLCSPNRWRLHDKLGGDMSGIHAPVARYSDDLSSPVNAMLARLSVERPVWRTNWGVSNHPSLFQPDAPPATPGMDPADLWFRVEWQTLRRLPVTGAILFTIRTYVEKMSQFMLRDYAVVHEVADVINKIPEDVARYKSIAPYRESLFAYLETR